MHYGELKNLEWTDIVINNNNNNGSDDDDDDDDNRMTHQCIRHCYHNYSGKRRVKFSKDI